MTDQGVDNLAKVDHVVVLMMENRSFDHMLGYLGAEMPELEGLDPDEHGNADSKGELHPVRPLRADELFNDKVLDPGHGKGDVAEQLEDRNGGFVRNFAKVLERNRKKHEPKPGTVLDETSILGHQSAEQVPVYDYLARHFQICDHWFSSVPGPTWSNRLFATTGGEGPTISFGSPLRLPKALRGAPIYDRVAFTRYLADDRWRWYSHDPATLRLVDSTYRPGGEKGIGEDENFAYFNRTSLLEWRTFVDDAKRGRLPTISWIDPNFVDFRMYGPPGSNDDHPPSLVMLGQELVLTVISALMSNAEAWKRTLLLITYDEHGGFYDHVVPGDFDIPGDPRASYGVRVPALVISPMVDAGVCKTVFDHTSIAKTILLKAAAEPEKAIEALGPRTREANHLGALLTRDEPRAPGPSEDLQRLFAAVRAWKEAAYEEALLEEPKLGERVFSALTQLQREVVGAAMALRGEGLPPGKP